jgi:PilZ domain
MNTVTHPSEMHGTDELRGSVRFPLTLPIHVITDHNSRLLATTQNISSGGVLFDVGEPISVGSRVEFQIDMPAKVLGTPTDVAVQCIGRVVRCLNKKNQNEVAVVIDDYCLERF